MKSDAKRKYVINGYPCKYPLVFAGLRFWRRLWHFLQVITEIIVRTPHPFVSQARTIRGFSYQDMIAWMYSGSVGRSSETTGGGDQKVGGKRVQIHARHEKTAPSCPPWKSTDFLKKNRPKRFMVKKVRAFSNRSPKFVFAPKYQNSTRLRGTHSYFPRLSSRCSGIPDDPFSEQIQAII